MLLFTYIYAIYDDYRIRRPLQPSAEREREMLSGGFFKIHNDKHDCGLPYGEICDCILPYSQPADWDAFYEDIKSAREYRKKREQQFAQQHKN